MLMNSTTRSKLINLRTFMKARKAICYESDVMLAYLSLSSSKIGYQLCVDLDYHLIS